MGLLSTLRRETRAVVGQGLCRIEIGSLQGVGGLGGNEAARKCVSGKNDIVRNKGGPVASEIGDIFLP